MPYAPLPIIAADFETRSKASLKALGGRLYAQHSSTQLLCGVIAWGGVGAWQFRETLNGKWVFPELRDGGYDLMAHNGAQFDRFVARRLGWPEPRRVIDTAQLARRAGLPEASLEWIGENIVGAPKDLEGNKLTKSLSRVSTAKARKGEYAIDPIPAETMARVVQYCRLDVEIMVKAWDLYLHHWDRVSELEDEVLALDTRVNDRGIRFDEALADAVLKVDARLAADALAAAGLADPTEIKSNDRFRAHMAGLGVQIDNAQKATVEALLDYEGPNEDAVRALAQARLSGNTIAGGKFIAAKMTAGADGRVRDGYKYFGAHTGRWSGQKAQLQNLQK